MYNSPAEHPRVSEYEKSYIRESGNKENSEVSKRPTQIPWRKILTSRSVIGLCITHFTFVWMLNTVLVGIPLFMQDVLYFNIKANGMLSSLPPLIQLFGGILIAMLGDFVHRTIIQSRHVMWKTFQTALLILAAGPIIGVGFMGCAERSFAVGLFCLTFSGITFVRGGSSLTPSDIAPRMAGSVYGLANFVANFSGFLVPIAIGNLTPNGS